MQFSRETLINSNKVHAGADAGSGYVYTITDTSANMHDVTETSKLLREDDHVMYGDSGYLGAPERSEIKEDEVLSKIEYRINQRPFSLKMADHFNGLNWDKKMEHELIQRIICQRQPTDVWQSWPYPGFC